MKPLIIIGCGGHAKSVIDIIETSKDWNIEGLIGQPEEVGKTILGYEVIGTDSDLEQIRSKVPFAILAIGQIASAESRIKLAKLLNNLGFELPTIASASSTVSKYAQIGVGTTIGHGAIVNASAKIGEHCIINSGALIEHDACIGNYCHISTGALINGMVTIGDESFIGSGTTIRNNLALPSGTIISAGKRVMGSVIGTSKTEQSDKTLDKN